MGYLIATSPKPSPEEEAKIEAEKQAAAEKAAQEQAEQAAKEKADQEQKVAARIEHLTPEEKAVFDEKMQEYIKNNATRDCMSGKCKLLPNGFIVNEAEWRTYHDGKPVVFEK